MRFHTVLYILSVSLAIVDNSAAYDGPIAGNRNISECISGGMSKSSKLDVIPSDFINQQGYKAEDHVVVTEDGHILTLNRIPGPQNAPVVLLHHGILATSFDWLVLGKNRALAFLLADQGYDVWLGNTRGGLYSSCHVKYPTSDYRFWNHSLYEIAVYDLPAEINYIQKISGSDKLSFIGHSTGVTPWYIMAIERPDLASKFEILLGLAPVAFLGHVRGIIPFLAPFATPVEPVVHYLMNGEVFKRTFLSLIFQRACISSRLAEQICLFFRFLAFGFDFEQVDYDTVPLFTYHGLVPSSFKILVQCAQLVVSGKFRPYDYGTSGNLKAYHSLTPPDYNLSKIKTPVGLIWGENDFFSTSKDVKHLHDGLPNVVLYQKVNFSKFNHLDFVHASNASDLLYTKVLSLFKSIRSDS